MKELSELVDLLSSESSSLTDALLKTKVLLHRLEKPELAEWATRELNGYPDGIEVPSYRVLPAVLLGNLSNAGWAYRAHPLPLLHLSESERDFCTRIPINASLSVVESLAVDDSGAEFLLPLEFNGRLGKALTNGFQIERAWRRVEAHNFRSVLIQVRSRLLDFLLPIQRAIGNTEVLDDVKTSMRGVQVQELFNQTVFGDNTVITFGQSNTVTVTQHAGLGNLEQLKASLRANKVTEPDIDALTEAIHLDESTDPAAEKKDGYGPAVREWIKIMLGKAADATWAVSLTAAGNILGEVLKNFYGR